MFKDKFFLKSKGIIGGLIAISVPVLGIFGIQIDPETTVEISTLLTLGVDHIEALITIFGGLLGIYGRYTAKTSLKLK